MRRLFISNDFPLRRAALLLLLGLGLGSARADPRTDLNQVRQHLQTLQQEYRQTQLRHAGARDALAAAEQAIAASVARLTTLKAQQGSVQASLAELQGQSAQLQALIAQQRTALAEDVRYAYLRPGNDALKLLLSDEDPNQAGRNLHYLAVLAATRQAQMQSLATHQSELAQLEQRAAARSAELAGIAKATQAQRVLLEQQRQLRQQLLARLDEKIASQKDEIATLKRDEARLSSLMQKLAREAAARAAALRRQEAARRRALARREQAAPPRRVAPAQTALPPGAPFASLRGRLSWPVAGELMSRFGAPRQGGGLTWKGIFIGAPMGTPVRSIAAGRVVFADRLRGFGELIIIDHGDGYMSLYSNNENLYKQVGDAVSAGEIIARTGDADGRSGEYFELRYRGRAINPEQWIR